jgi:hypothetical protein
VLQQAVELRHNRRACEWRRVECLEVVSTGRELQPGRPWGLDNFLLPTSLLAPPWWL